MAADRRRRRSGRGHYPARRFKSFPSLAVIVPFRARTNWSRFSPPGFYEAAFAYRGTAARAPPPGDPDHRLLGGVRSPSWSCTTGTTSCPPSYELDLRNLICEGHWRKPAIAGARRCTTRRRFDLLTVRSPNAPGADQAFTHLTAPCRRCVHRRQRRAGAGPAGWARRLYKSEITWPDLYILRHFIPMRRNACHRSPSSTPRNYRVGEDCRQSASMSVALLPMRWPAAPAVGLTCSFDGPAHVIHPGHLIVCLRRCG